MVKCADCKEEAIEGQKRCPYHAERKRNLVRKGLQNKYDKGLCIGCGINEYKINFKFCEECLLNDRDKTKRLKLKVYDAYGGQFCQCCGETEISFLSLDHINNDGAKHRREISAHKMSGKTFYKWLIKNNFPYGLQVLCMNCQFGKKQNNGVCPHQNELQEQSTLDSCLFACNG